MNKKDLARIKAVCERGMAEVDTARVSRSYRTKMRAAFRLLLEAVNTAPHKLRTRAALLQRVSNTYHSIEIDFRYAAAERAFDERYGGVLNRVHFWASVIEQTRNERKLIRHQLDKAEQKKPCTRT